jgi:hypothetical protein
MALTHAAAGDFEKAWALQDSLIEMAQMMGAWMLMGSLKQTADTYRAGSLPEPWPIQDPLLMPSPPNPGSPIRNYPAGQPY